MFLLFVFIDSLCKFVIYSRYKSGDEKLRFWFQFLQLCKECEVVLRADKDLSIFLLARSKETLIFANQYLVGCCWMIKLDYFQTTA